MIFRGGSEPYSFLHLLQICQYDMIMTIVATVWGGLEELNHEAASVENGAYGTTNRVEMSIGC